MSFVRTSVAGHIRPLLDPRYRRSQLAALAALLFLAVYSAGLILRPSEGYLRVQSSLIYNLVPLAALALALVPALRSRGRERLGWLCLAMVLVTWQAGDWTFTFYDFVKNSEPPFPGFADAAYYPGYLAFIAAIPLLTFPKGRSENRRWIIDAMVVMIVAGVLAWEYVMRPILADNAGGAFSAAVALGYPILDLGLLTILVVTLYASGGRFSTPALLLAAAGLFQIVSDGAYTYVLTTTGYDNVGNPMELGWLTAYLLLAVCFLLPDEPTRRSTSSRPSLVGAVLPYAMGLPLVVLLIVSAVRAEPSLLLLAGAIGTVALVVLRQFLTLRENVVLLTRAANFDELTGLPNRRRFVEEVRRRLAGESRGGEAGALILLGLDDLKAVNESFGRHAGDEVVTRAAEVLRGHAPADAAVARLEGDEFVVFLPWPEPSLAEAATQKLLRALQERPTLVGAQIVRTTASAGVALMPQHGRTVDDLLSSADLAMYEAKVTGGNRVRVHDPAIGGQAVSEARLIWKERIVDALERGRFVLYAQPIVNIRTRQTHEYELLIRMVDDGGRVIPPSEFLATAERFGLIMEIDRWVVREALRLLDEERPGPWTALAVNLSGLAFEDGELVSLIGRELADRDLQPNLLTFEVTETAAIANIDRAEQFIGRLKNLGCRFALDDFGVGFSSFSHLKHLPVDYLKIDGSFIRGLPGDQAEQHIVQAIAALARGLGKETVAEFVQDEATVEVLRELGVDYGQGYYLGRPRPASETLPAGGIVRRLAA